MKTIQVTFGTGPDTVIMTDTANSIPAYLAFLEHETPWQVEEITKIEEIDPLVDIAQKAFALLDEGSDIVSAFVKQELAKLLRVDESDVSWQTPEWQRVQEIVRSLV